MTSDRASDTLLRDLAPKVVGAVARRYGDFAAAEDAVQEALLAAATQWPDAGVPDNPGGWLYQVASRRMTDQLRSDAARRRREALVEPIDTGTAVHEDDSLVVLFMCCHPALTMPSAIALTLRAVGGLTTAEIASAFLVPEKTMAQRISRAKLSIKASGLSFEMPSPQDYSARLAAVLHVLYLIFNEGYASTSGPSLHRVELSAEAIRLARAVHALLPDEAEVGGLLALMLLTDARRPARTGPAGELTPLGEQDRRLWNRDAIVEGTTLAERAMARGPVGPYQLQAAIAALHGEAARVEDTDWPQILALYDVLRRMADNPLVELSFAVATAMVHGPSAGLTLVAALEGDDRVAGTHRLDAVRGHLHEMAGDPVRAIAHYRAAAGRTASIPERNYLMMKAAQLAASSN